MPAPQGFILGKEKENREYAKYLIRRACHKTKLLSKYPKGVSLMPKIDTFAFIYCFKFNSNNSNSNFELISQSIKFIYK